MTELEESIVEDFGYGKFFAMSEEQYETLREVLRKHPECHREVVDKVGQIRYYENAGLTLDAVSASNFRHVLKGVADIVNKMEDTTP